MRFSEHSLPTGEIKLFHSAVLSGRRAYNAHHHSVLELSLPVKGSGIYTVNGKEITFNTGDLFLFAADEPHCVTFISPPDGLELLNIWFELRLLCSDSAYLPLLKLFNSRSPSFSGKAPSSDPNTAELHRTASKIEYEFNTKKDGYEIRIRLLLYSMLLELYRCFDIADKKESAFPSSELLPLLSESVKYIDTHFTEDISLSDISEKAHLSRAYFSTVFKKYTGISPFDYITIKRVEKAVEYLKTTSLSKLEIASLCGFNSSSNFYKAFSKVTGRKPNDYIF